MSQEQNQQSEVTTIGVSAVAQSLGVSRATVLRWIVAGKLTGFFRIGHKWLIRKSDFDSFINQKVEVEKNFLPPVPRVELEDEK